MTETPEVVGAVGSSSNRGLSPCFTNPRLIQTTKLTVPTGFVGSRCTGGGGQEGLRSLQFLVDGLQGPDLKLSGAVGVETLTLSPTRFPIRPRPMGDEVEIKPLLRSASSVVANLYSTSVPRSRSYRTTLEPKAA